MANDPRVQGALEGLFFADALAMPVHWYYDRAALRADYGEVRDYLAPRNPHPSSILYRSRYVPPGPGGDILHEQAAYWGRPGIHYHQFLAAGENTLNLKLARVLCESLRASGGHDPDDFLRRFEAFLTVPGRHRDTYAEEYLRGFFRHRARGVDPHRCAVEEKHVGGLVFVVPVVLFHRDEPARAREAARAQLALTHAGERMAEAGGLVVDLLLAVLRGTPLREAIDGAIAEQRSPLLGHPFARWEREPDERVVGGAVSSACYLPDAVPAVLHLARRYHDDPERAIVANTMLGGDNAHRGAVLGALLGAAHGPDAWPERWRTGLVEPVPEL